MIFFKHTPIPTHPTSLLILNPQETFFLSFEVYPSVVKANLYESEADTVCVIIFASILNPFPFKIGSH